MTAARPVLSLGLGIAAALLAGGCLRTTSYECDSDSACVRGVQGTCEDVGYCSFPDDACASGRRFADGAGAHADECVADLEPDARVDAPTDAAVDAAVDAASLPCDDPGNGTTFATGNPCAAWGAPFSTNVSVQNLGDRLVLTAAANQASASGGCRHAPVPFTAAGVLAEVDRPLAGTTSRTRLELQEAGLWIGVVGGRMQARAGALTLASVPYDPIAMRWWRMRPVAGEVWYETAPDGHAWSRLATSSPAPATSAIRIVAETPAAEAAPGVARIESVNLCP